VTAKLRNPRSEQIRVAADSRIAPTLCDLDRNMHHYVVIESRYGQPRTEPFRQLPLCLGRDYEDPPRIDPAHFGGEALLRLA
jgi:hypothetical protein